MNAPLVVIASWLLAVVDQMEILGIPRQKLIGESQEFAPLRLVPSAHFELAVTRRLWHRASELSDDPLLGLKVGKRMPLQAMNVLSIILMHSPNVRGAFANLDRYERLVGNNGHFVADWLDGSLRLTHRELPCHVPLHYSQTDSIITAVLRFFRLSGLADLAPIRVSLSSPYVDLKAEYEDFFRCQVSFGEEEASIEFDDFTLDRRLPNADSSLLELGRNHAEAMLSRLNKLDSLAQSVRAMMGARHFTEVSCAEVAKNLGISHRTLQRRLAEVGHTFRELFEAARMDEAFHLLTQSSLSLSQIADNLGYSEPSAFSRAFRNWFGVSPGQQRSKAPAH
ncbi:AraC family transcriptional regulator [Paraburkholderia fungorum]|jgi:AraC-like DNA-binding protein|uniref:AraC family transcriptional regulator n=1 Tax=Paraburkholderia fungorum TaxID=134537 RepID=UPI000690BF8E|nr:AraC family transcriptional regulator [Paraburkholderia fungorum]MBU7436215.1 AraC family transcriptional regulator [Paraburkholderia fungorum]